MNTLIKRGDILRATSGEHKGDYYLFARIASGEDQNFLGEKHAGIKRYAYNLFNLSSGKARQTESHKIFTSFSDGIVSGFDISRIEKHFGMTFELATDMVTVGPKVTEVIAKQENQDESIALVKDFMKAIGEAMGVGFVPVQQPAARMGWSH